MSPTVTFYKPYAIPATFFTLFTCYLLLAWGSGYYVLTLLWIKAASSAGMGAIFHFTRAEQLTFYQNLGFSAIRLYLFAAAFDFVIWLLFIIIAFQFL